MIIKNRLTYHLPTFYLNKWCLYKDILKCCELWKGSVFFSMGPHDEICLHLQLSQQTSWTSPSLGFFAVFRTHSTNCLSDCRDCVKASRELLQHALLTQSDQESSLLLWSLLDTALFIFLRLKDGSLCRWHGHIVQQTAMLQIWKKSCYRLAL